MVKGLIGSLISAAVFFVAGGISMAILGTNESEHSKLKGFSEFGYSFDKLLLNSDEDGTWHFDNYPEIALDLSNVKARIVPVDDDRVSLTVSSDDVSIGIRRLSILAALDDDGKCLAISINRGGFFLMDFSSIKAEIGLPRGVYDRLQLSVGSGSVEAIGVNAHKNDIWLGSGKLLFSQSPDFTAERFNVDMGSGSMEVTNSAAKNLSIGIGSGSLIMETSKTEEFDISMGSGKFEVSGLSGRGDIDVASGNGIARFADARGIDGSEFELSSGSLYVYFPKNVNAKINGSVSSGSIVVDCAGVDAKLRHNDTAVLGNGGAEITADVSSGKLSILENNGSSVVAAVTVTEGVEVTADTGYTFKEKDFTETL